jgi:hypothetical protein
MLACSSGADSSSDSASRLPAWLRLYLLPNSLSPLTEPPSPGCITRKLRFAQFVWFNPDQCSTWYMGSIIAAWVTYGTFRLENTWSWRIPSVLQGVPSLVQILLVFWLVPESPRWLVSHGRVPEARAILLKWHCNGDETDPLIDFEMHEITEGIRLDQEIAQTTTYRSVFATPGHRRRMLAIIPYSFFSQWSGVSRRQEVFIGYMLTIRTASSLITSILRLKVSVSPRPNNKILSMVCFSYGMSSQPTLAPSRWTAWVDVHFGLPPPRG